jgi:F-type H+-transporting ATPase subunit delta
MAESLTIARPYAEAAFKLACERNALANWSAALERLAAVAGSSVARSLIGNPKVTVEQVSAVVADTAGQLDTEQSNFVRVLAENDRLGVLPEISAAFETLRNAHEGVLDAHIASAFPLTDEQLSTIVATLADKYGKQVKASVKVEPELIGGVSIRIGDEVIDASVRSKLAQMASMMKV